MNGRERRDDEKRYSLYFRHETTTPGILSCYMDAEETERWRNDPIGLCQELNRIVRVWEAVEDYPIIRLLLQFNSNAKYFMASFYRYDPDRIADAQINEIMNVAKCLLRLFALLEITDVNYSSGRIKAFLFKINGELVDPSYGVEGIVNWFRDHISSEWPNDDRSYIFNMLVEQPCTNAIVWLNEYLFSESKREAFNVPSSVNIEHIMPNSGRNLTAIRRDAGIFSKDEFENYADRIGNKILLEEDINKSLGNDWFRTKKSSRVDGRPGGYVNSRFSLAKSLVEYNPRQDDKWMKDDIDKASRKAAQRIIDFIFS